MHWEDPQAAAAETELLAKLDGVNDTRVWTFTYAKTDYEVELSLAQQVGKDMASLRPPAASFQMQAHACGQRTLYQSASACATTYAIAVEGTLTLRRLGADPVTVVSDVAVTGMLSNLGEISLSFDDNKVVLQSDGRNGFTVSEVSATGLGKESLNVSFTKSR